VAEQQRAEDLANVLFRKLVALERQCMEYRERVDEAEAIIRAQNTLNVGTAVELEDAYSSRYGVDLGSHG
jgi:hypothetical protein